MATALTYPFRIVRARVRTRALRRLHRAEVEQGRALAARADRTPIFILGAPRSGTTLLYQLLTEGFDVGWLANAHLASPGEVSTIERSDRPRATRTSTDWESSHGSTPDAWGPNEAGAFFYRCVPRTPHQLADADATPTRIEELRAVIRLFADACGSSVVFKNTFNSLRIPLLARALPEARFVMIDRDIESNARSLLVGRAKRGDLSGWWGVVPEGADALDGANPAEQVVWQTTRINEIAHAELERLAADRTFIISYDELCADPRGLLVRLDAWLGSTGADVALRDEARIPAQFDRRGGGELDAVLEAQLQTAVRQVHA